MVEEVVVVVVVVEAPTKIEGTKRADKVSRQYF
jgi:hypothetical protein